VNVNLNSNIFSTDQPEFTVDYSISKLVNESFDKNRILYAYSLIALGIDFPKIDQNERDIKLSHISKSYTNNVSLKLLVDLSEKGILNPKASISSIVALFENKKLDNPCEDALIDALKKSLEWSSACYYFQLQEGSRIIIPRPSMNIAYLLRETFITQHDFREFRAKHMENSSFSTLASVIVLEKTMEDIDTKFLIELAERTRSYLDIRSIIFLYGFYASALSFYRGNLLVDMSDDISIEILLKLGCGLFLTEEQRATLLSKGKYSGLSPMLLGNMNRLEFLREIYRKLDQDSKLRMISLLDKREYTLLLESVWNDCLEKGLNSLMPGSVQDLEPCAL